MIIETDRVIIQIKRRDGVIRERIFIRTGTYIWSENGFILAQKVCQLLEKALLGVDILDQKILELL